jgi:HEAT repeat protein
MKSAGILISIILMCCVFGVSYGEGLIQDVREAIKNPDLQIHLAAVDKLAGRKDRETIDILIRIAENRSEHWKVQLKAIDLLGKAGDPRSIDLLTFILNSNASEWKCPAIQSYAATALGNFNNNMHVIEALVKGMRNEEVIIREASIRALGNIGNPEVIPQLLPMLKDANIAVRIGTVEALWRIRDRRAVFYLKEVSENDLNIAVRGAARRALGFFDNSEVIDVKNSTLGR